MLDWLKRKLKKRPPPKNKKRAVADARNKVRRG